MRKPESELPFTFFKKCRFNRSFSAFSALAFWLLAIALSCGTGDNNKASVPPDSRAKWDRRSAEKEYRTLMAQIDLANTGQIYLAVDFNKGALKLMLKGAVVWDCRMDLEFADSLEVREFIDRFRGDNERLVRPLAGKYLYEATDKISDSILTVVGEAVKVDPRMLQRDLPERFQLIWEDDMIMEIHTDIEGRPISIFKNAIEEIRRKITSPFGKATVIMKMEPDDALTLFRASERGMLTIVAL